MTSSPLQIISVSDREKKLSTNRPRTDLLQMERLSLSLSLSLSLLMNHTRESNAAIHQQRERASPSEASPFNDLAPEKNDSNQNKECT